MKKTVVLAVVFTMITGAIWANGGTDQGEDDSVIINYYGKPDEELELQIIEMFENENPNIKVNYTALTGGSNEKLRALQTLLQANDDSIDVFVADATWPTIFNAAGWAASYDDIEGAIDDEFVEMYMTTENFIFDDKLYGIPFQANVGALFYRIDLLEKYGLDIPTTWDELESAAITIIDGEGNPDLKGYGASWKQSEGLSCAALEHIWPEGIEIESGGELDVDLDKLEDSIQFMVNLMDSGISPQEMPTFGNDHRAIYKAGNLIFARDWATSTTGHFLNPEGNEYYDKTGVTIMPGGHGTLGNWGLMIAASSKNKEAAAAFAKFRASEPILLLQNETIGALPPMVSAYDEEGIEGRLLGYRNEILEIVRTSKSRSNSPYWGEISQVIQVQVHSALSGLVTPEEAAKAIEEGVSRILQ